MKIKDGQYLLGIGDNRLYRYNYSRYYGYSALIDTSSSNVKPHPYKAKDIRQAISAGTVRLLSNEEAILHLSYIL